MSPSRPTVTLKAVTYHSLLQNVRNLYSLSLPTSVQFVLYIGQHRVGFYSFYARSRREHSSLSCVIVRVDFWQDELGKHYTIDYPSASSIEWLTWTYLSNLDPWSIWSIRTDHISDCCITCPRTGCFYSDSYSETTDTSTLCDSVGPYYSATFRDPYAVSAVLYYSIVLFRLPLYVYGNYRYSSAYDSSPYPLLLKYISTGFARFTWTGSGEVDGTCPIRCKKVIDFTAVYWHSSCR